MASLCVLCHVDAVLRVLDAEVSRVGASRASGDAAKSVARVVGPPECVADCAGWEREYIRASTFRNPPRKEHVWGVDVGTEHRASKQFENATNVVEELHEAFTLVDDTACAFILLRKCAQRV